MSTKSSGKTASIGSKLVKRLEKFKAALESERPLSESYTCRKVVLDLVPTHYEPELVKKTRQVLGASQAVFARFLGTSVSTVQAWEQGRNHPSEIACRFMDEIRSAPDRFRARLAELVKTKP